MPQFVLLLHECPSGVPRGTHFDLMLHVGDVLRTWVLYQLPEAWSALLSGAPAVAIRTDAAGASMAEEIQPHRLDYLTLEGPLSGNRGSVRRLDRGTYDADDVSDRRIRVRLAGERIRGLLEMTRPDADTPYWHVSFLTAAATE